MTILRFRDIFQPDTLTLGTAATTGDMILSLVITLILAIFIFFIYKKTYSGVLYSRSFNISLIITSLVVTGIMISIGSNLALSLGMVGALSIVRFRTAVKDPKDVTFLFWAISIGIMNGAFFYKLSIIASIFIGITLLIFAKKFVISDPYVIILKYQGKIEEKTLMAILKKHCSKYKLKNVVFSDTGNERIIEVKIKARQEENLLQELKNIKGIEKAMMFSHTGELTE